MTDDAYLLSLKDKNRVMVCWLKVSYVQGIPYLKCQQKLKLA